MPEPRPDRVPAIERADLPDVFTPDTVRDLPLTTLRRLAGRRNDVLTRDEQREFDKAVHEVMRDAAQRVSQRLDRADWAAVKRDENARRRPGRPASRTDAQLDRITRRIGRQVDLAETLAPDVDWSFAQPAALPEPAPTPEPEPAQTEPPDVDDQSGTVSDLEQRINDQVELVEVMTEIAEVSRRTYDLEQQRDLQSTRTVFFGLVVSIAVLVAGWAPLVAADDWAQRWWIVGLTVGTCVVAAAVYGLVRYWQNRSDAESGDGA